MKDIHDVITHAKFGDDRLRGSGVVAGQISAFPIDFAGRPYNTLTLPCERVMLLRESVCKLPSITIYLNNTSADVLLRGKQTISFNRLTAANKKRDNPPLYAFWQIKLR